MTTDLKIEQRAPESLAPNPWNSNVVSPENEKKLEASVRFNGFYKPVICRQLPDGTMQILGGEHRARAAHRIGIPAIPVVNLGSISDKKAKAIGLADNGRYGEDDAIKLSEIIKSIGVEEAELMLPFSDKDLASLFTISNIGFDDLDLDAGDREDETLPEIAAKATVTHQVMRFKVSLEDSGRVQELLDKLIKAGGYTKEDSLTASGMALVDLVGIAREHI